MPFEHRARMPVKITSRIPWSASNFLAKNISASDTVLDLGCGPCSPLHDLNVFYSVGVEIFDPYVSEAKRLNTHNDLIKADITKIDFRPGFFDVVLLFNVLEHLGKEESDKLITKMIQWAKKKVIIITPNGYAESGVRDGDPFQIHRCGYTIDELKRWGFTVYGEGLKFIRDLPWPWSRFNFLTFTIFHIALAPVIYHHPQKAAYLLAIYRKD